MDAMHDLAAALNGHEVTNEDGHIEESETSEQETAPVEQTTVDEPTKVEKPTETEELPPKEEDTGSKKDDESQPVEDETGKRYVPESRFNKIYGKAKETERELAALKERLAHGEALLQGTKKPPTSGKSVEPTKADILELKMTLPQFDPRPDPVTGEPTNPEYDQDIDNLGFTILRANPGMTPLQAGMEAVKQMHAITEKVSKKIGAIKSDARMVKTLQSDQGITSRVISRDTKSVDTSSMSDVELEKYLKETGQW